MVDVLDEAGGGEAVALVEDLPADAAAGRQPLLGEPHAQPRDVVLRNENAGPVLAELVSDVLLLELLDDRGGVLRRQVREQRDHGGRGEADDDEGEEADEHKRHDAHRGHAPRAEAPEKLNQP